jgi:Zn-dependent protease with chaperone function
MSTTGPGTFYDGLTSARNSVTVELVDGLLRISATDGRPLAEWRCAEIAPVATPEGVLRLGLPTGESAARLEIHDKALADAVAQAALPCDRTGLTDERVRNRVVRYSLLAAVMVIAAAIWAVPAIANRVAPLLPRAVDIRFGELANEAIQHELEEQTKGKTVDCSTGNTAQEKAARAAFTKIVDQLIAGADLPIPMEVRIVHVDDINAITLPGGHVYVYAGIPKNANSPDEFASVIAHEFGHAAHRDGIRSQVQTGGLSLMLGLLLNDFAGGGALIFTANTLLKNAYSRGEESAADMFGARLLAKIGADPHSLGAFLVRASGKPVTEDHFLLDHPEAEARAAAVDKVPEPAVRKQLLTPDEWTALKKICTEG